MVEPAPLSRGKKRSMGTWVANNYCGHRFWTQWQMRINNKNHAYLTKQCQLFQLPNATRFKIFVDVVKIFAHSGCAPPSLKSIPDIGIHAMGTTYTWYNQACTHLFQSMFIQGIGDTLVECQWNILLPVLCQSLCNIMFHVISAISFIKLMCEVHICRSIRSDTTKLSHTLHISIWSLTMHYISSVIGQLPVLEQ